MIISYFSPMIPLLTTNASTTHMNLYMPNKGSYTDFHISYIAFVRLDKKVGYKNNKEEVTLRPNTKFELNFARKTI